MLGKQLHMEEPSLFLWYSGLHLLTALSLNTSPIKRKKKNSLCDLSIMEEVFIIDI